MKQCFYCERVATHKGMCQAHYKRAWRGGTMDAPLAPQDGHCSAAGCARPASEHGLCHSHARRARRGRSVDGPIRERRDDQPATCTHDSCNLPSYAKSLCHGHYRRLLHPPKPGTYRFWESGLSPEWWRAVVRMAESARPRRETPWDRWLKSSCAFFVRRHPKSAVTARPRPSTWQAAIRAMCRASLREAWRARRDPWDHWCERRVKSFGKRQRRKHDSRAAAA
jgi:hypothetical protein